MRNFLPQIFHLFALQAHRATEEQDGLQIPEQWILLIEALPLISENYYHHLFQSHERCLEMILSSISRVLLAILTKWPTKITQTIDRTRTYRMQKAWNPDGEILKNIPWKKILINGNQHLLSNIKQFPIQLLRLAWFTVGKVSQSKYPIKRFNKLLHLTVGGVIFAKTHYSSVLMSTLWSAPYLLVINKNDTTLVNYIVREAHTLMLPDNLGKSLHLPHHLTMNRVLSSDLCPTFISELRVVVSKYIGNCFHCNKVAARGGTFRPYHHF